MGHTFYCEGEIRIYDSLYTSVSHDKVTTIAHLLRSNTESIAINIMDVGRQRGTQDCGLFAIAFLTSLSFGEDPTKVIFDQEEMRSHLVKCFENKRMEIFPVLRKEGIDLLSG